MATPVNLSLLERLDLIPAHLSLVSSALYHAISGPFRGQSGAYTYKHHITHAVVRKMLARYSTLQLQYSSPTFSQLYDQWAAKNKVTPNKVRLSTGTEAFWVGDPKADYVVIYYHGGGFSLEGGAEHFQFWGNDVLSDLKSAGKSVAFLFLQYTLVPHGTYPVQVTEAIEGLRYVTQDLKRSADTILLGGDSAGGNMALAVLSQALHPSPDLPKVYIDKPLKGLVLIAPWVRFVHQTESVANNKYKDIVTAEVAEVWSSGYLAGKETSPYIEPGTADASWWKDAPVEHIVCVAGRDELLFDAITEWVGKYKSVNGPESITFVIGEHEVHIAPLIELRLGDTTPTQQGEAIKSCWTRRGAFSSGELPRFKFLRQAASTASSSSKRSLSKLGEIAAWPPSAARANRNKNKKGGVRKSSIRLAPPALQPRRLLESPIPSVVDPDDQDLHSISAQYFRAFPLESLQSSNEEEENDGGEEGTESEADTLLNIVAASDPRGAGAAAHL
ncbi:hypothetical protein DV735_g4636, partial [Chaetothyriales sp. CBS 134920]